MTSTGGSSGIALIVGANIRRARDDAGLLQRELGAALGIGTQQVSDWERGAYRPNDENLLRIAEALGKNFAWFFAEHPADDPEVVA